MMEMQTKIKRFSLNRAALPLFFVAEAIGDGRWFHRGICP